MDNIIENKSLDFAVRIVKLSQFLASQYHEYVLSKQVLKSGTSIGANVAEAEQAQSNNDFVSKMSIALKETSETKYWIELLYRTNYIDDVQHTSLKNDCIEIEKMLVRIVKNSKGLL